MSYDLATGEEIDERSELRSLYKSAGTIFEETVEAN